MLSGDDGVEMQNHPAMSEEEEPDEELLGPAAAGATFPALPALPPGRCVGNFSLDLTTIVNLSSN